jgi:hypothetical protein
VLSLVSDGDQSYARIIAQPRLLDLNELGDLGIRGVQRFELLEARGPHTGFVERAVIRQQMLVATDGEKNTGTKKQSARLHVSMLARSKNRGLACAVGGTCAEGQVKAES